MRFSGGVHSIVIDVPGELVEAYGGMDGAQLLCAGYVNEYG
uniref:Uncharacterized protein n=1 Tax=Candidatus Methanogaster sp. ANME-2c ERB4 TaxID=2759911 RepID=A0A7G9Y7G2_9EURY|nr:hypothetical protein HIDCGLNP_00001 [Methanosarcinales archaeon ANME-2c ERB4]QNO43946.1 hypothetical protein CFDKNGMC_00006 [Methanosarcinales archaeon ANME-2c ERB4]